MRIPSTGTSSKPGAVFLPASAQLEAKWRESRMLLPLPTTESVDDSFPPVAAGSERSGTSNRKESTASILLPTSVPGGEMARYMLGQAERLIPVHEAFLNQYPQRLCHARSKTQRFHLGGLHPCSSGSREERKAEVRMRGTRGLGWAFRAVKAPAGLRQGMGVSPLSWVEPHAASSMLGKTDSVPLHSISRCFQNSAAVFLVENN